MNFQQSYTALETQVPGIDTNPAHINPGGPPPSYFADTPYPGGSLMTIAGPQWCAGLSKRPNPLPAGLGVSGTTKAVVSYQIMQNALAAVYDQADECDLMVTDAATPANLLNGSVRKNHQTGYWEVVTAAGTWASTGFKGGAWTPGAWVQVNVTYLITWGAAPTMAVIAISDGVFTWTPATPTPVPAIKNSGWAGMLVDVQRQVSLLAAGEASVAMTALSVTLE